MSEGQVLVPRLRFPEFRHVTGWREYAGSDLFDQVNNRNVEVSFPILAITQEHGAIPRELIDYHVSVTEKSIESYKVVNVGDFIISLRSFQGGIEYSRYRGSCSPAYVILRRRIEGNDAYFRHYLKTDEFIQLLTRNLEGLRDGKMISYKQFSELRLPVPPAPEQQKIADFLSTLDRLIAAQACKVDVLKTHKQGLMQQLFPRDGESQPRLRFPDYRNNGAWKEVFLKEVFSVFQGFAFSSSDSVEEGVRWLKIADVGIQQMNHNAPSFLPASFQDQFCRFALREGDYVMALTRPILNGQLKIAQVDQIFAGALLNQRVGKLITSHHAVFIYFLLQRDQTVIDIEKCISGAEPPNLSAQQTENIKTRIPSPLEQQRIADCLTSIDDLITTATKELDTLKTHKKGLMQQLFPAPAEVVA
jgi:type I restriction enzyme S subunit